jgi:hypothetical protein
MILPASLSMVGENRQLVTDEPVEVQDCRKFKDHCRGINRIYPTSIEENRRMSTCNRLDLQTLGSQLIMPKNLTDHCSSCKNKDSSKLTFASTSRPRKTTKYIVWQKGRECWYQICSHSQVIIVISGGFNLCCILVMLSALQHNGTHLVLFLFARSIMAWLFCNNTIGLYNLFNHNLEILRAVSPYYFYNYFKMSGKNGWISLGGVLLRITGRLH